MKQQNNKLETIFSLASSFLLIVISLFLLYLLILGLHLAFPIMQVSNSDLIGILSSILGGFIGGILTLLGVKLTIKHNEKENNRDNLEKYFFRTVPELLEKNVFLQKQVNDAHRELQLKLSDLTSSTSPEFEVFIESKEVVRNFNLLIIDIP